MDYQKIIWNSPERVTAEKLKRMEDNYQAVRYLNERTPKGIIALASNSDPFTIDTDDQIIIYMVVDQEKGRTYRIKAVNNNPIWGTTNTILMSLERYGLPVRQKYTKPTLSVATPYSGKKWETANSLEFINRCTITASVPWQLNVTRAIISGGAPTWYWKADQSAISADQTFIDFQKGDFYISIEDIGVTDI